MKALPFRHDPVAPTSRAPQANTGGADAGSSSAFGHLLADIDTGSKTPAKTPAVMPGTPKFQAAPAAISTSDGATSAPTDVAWLVERLMGRDAASATQTGSSTETSDVEPETTTAATPDAATSGVTLPGLLPALVVVPTKSATVPLAQVAAGTADPTDAAARSLRLEGGQGSTESLVAAATGALTVSRDAPPTTVSALVVGGQVAPAMITSMSRSLATTGDTGSARASQKTASPAPIETEADSASVDDAVSSAPSEPSPASPTAAVASDDPAPSKQMPAIAGLGGSDMAAMVAVPQTTASPVTAVIDAVASMASRMPDEAAAGSSGIALARTMTLQITPGTSGTISIRMRLIGRGLDLKLSVSDPRTLGQIERERDTLSAALHDQSYTLDTLVIQGGDAAASGADHDTMHQPAGGAGSQASADSGGRSASGGGGGAAPPGPQPDREIGVAAAASGAVFV